MFYPTGNSPQGKLLVCMKDSSSEIEEALKNCNESCMVECLTEWLDENSCCVESWQLRDYLKKRGLNEDQINEDMAAGSAGPAVGGSSLGSVTGMGNPATPQNGGTNSGFYNSSLDGSGDTFSSSRINKKSKGRVVETFFDFLKKKKKSKKTE